MKNIKMVLFAMLATFAVVAFAKAPVLKVTKSVTIDAPADKVWGEIKDFGGLADWHPALAKSEIVKGKDNKVGAERLLTLKDGGTIKEKLLAYDGKHMSYKYEILEGVLPVSHYSSTISVKSDGKGKSTVTWSGSFKRKNTADNPADNENDETATKTIASVYEAGLDNLKKMSE